MNKTDKPFDPLLFNGLGSKRDRLYNNILYSMMSFNAALSIPIGLYILNGIIEKWYYHDWFLISYVVCIFNVLIFFTIWCYLHIFMFKYARKHIDKSNPILVCQYQGSFKNYCVWALGFLYIFITYSIAIVLSIFAPPFIVVVLFHIFLSKPFLLKRILLFKDYVILEYRILGNVKLSREGLALITLPRRSYRLNISPLAFVRPVFFNNKYVIPYFCTRFNPFGMSNVNTLIKELDSQMGYSAYEMTKNKKVFTSDIDWNCLKIYL